MKEAAQWLVLFMLRGMLLWLVFPAGFAVWLVLRVGVPIWARGLRPGMLIGYLDAYVTWLVLRMVRLPNDGPRPAWSELRAYRRPSVFEVV